MYDKIIEYEELADKVHNKLTYIYIVDTLKHYNLNKWGDLTIAERQKLTNWVYNIWLKQELNLAIGCICDSTMENKKKILSGSVQENDFIEDLAFRWAN